MLHLDVISARQTPEVEKVNIFFLHHGIMSHHGPIMGPTTSNGLDIPRPRTRAGTSDWQDQTGRCGASTSNGEVSHTYNLRGHGNN